MIIRPDETQVQVRPYRGVDQKAGIIFVTNEVCQLPYGLPVKYDNSKIFIIITITLWCDFKFTSQYYMIHLKMFLHKICEEKSKIWTKHEISICYIIQAPF